MAVKDYVSVFKVSVVQVFIGQDEVLVKKKVQRSLARVVKKRIFVSLQKITWQQMTFLEAMAEIDGFMHV